MGIRGGRQQQLQLPRSTRQVSSALRKLCQLPCGLTLVTTNLQKSLVQIFRPIKNQTKQPTNPHQIFQADTAPPSHSLHKSLLCREAHCFQQSYWNHPGLSWHYTTKPQLITSNWIGPFHFYYLFYSCNSNVSNLYTSTEDVLQFSLVKHSHTGLFIQENHCTVYVHPNCSAKQNARKPKSSPTQKWSAVFHFSREEPDVTSMTWNYTTQTMPNESLAKTSLSDSIRPLHITHIIKAIWKALTEQSTE